MACDQALAEAVGRGGSPPVLRLYAWDPPSLSVGYNQPLRDRRPQVEELRARGFGAVRRPTGGGAVLHAREVTYSVIAALDPRGWTGGPREACEAIHAAILAGLAGLGIEDLAMHGNGGPTPGGRPPVCFAATSRSEVAWRGRKLVGSAQRRLAGTLLQHGSILLGGAQRELEALWGSGFREPRVATLDEAGGRAFAFGEVAEAVRAGFEGGLAPALEASALAPAEKARLEQLVVERYGSDAFLYRC